MPDQNFGEVTFSAEQVTEMHRTLENDHTVTETELPGVVDIYMHVGGAKLLFTQYKAGKVQDALDAAAAEQSKSSKSSKS